MDILRVTARWSGFSGAPGYSAFHFSSDAGFWDGGIFGDEAQIAAEAAASRVRSAFSEMNTRLPEGVTVSIEPGVEVIDSDSGEIQGMIDLENNYSITGAGNGGYAGPAGVVVNWRTNDYRFGRRIRGRTFLVPITTVSYQDDGTITTNALEFFRDFGTTMIGSGGGPTFGVWSRPRNGSGGVFATAVSSNVPDMVAILRSRRD